MTDIEIIEQARSIEQQRCNAIKTAFSGDPDFIFAAIVNGWSLEQARENCGPEFINDNICSILNGMRVAARKTEIDYQSLKLESLKRKKENERRLERIHGEIESVIFKGARNE